LNIETLLIAITVIVFIIALWTMWPSVIGAVYIPTPMDTVRTMLQLAEVNQNDTLIDLGSGDGRIILEAAKTHGASSVGVEADPLRVLWARSRNKV
jgi:phospholipid N-methyltransferase